MNISIFGLGYVGCISLGCLAQNGHRVIGIDTNQLKIDLINQGSPTIVEKDIDIIIKKGFDAGRISATNKVNEAIMESDISIICVGTPSTTAGHLNLDYIYNTANEIGEALKLKDSFHIIAIRSTVLPGTNQNYGQIIENVSGKKRNIDFAVVSNPEFLREGTAVQDYFNPPLTVIGSDNEHALNIMQSIYEGLNSPIEKTDIKVAEIIKYVNNSYHALKITFANEVGNICKQLDIDSYSVMHLFGLDKQLNISTYYFKPGFAYGGSCLPKDLGALRTLAHDLYIETPVLNSIEKSNGLQKEIALKLIQSKQKQKILVLGISFKSGTDDLRFSPVIDVVQQLIGLGYDIQLIDQQVHLSRIIGKNKSYIMEKLPHIAKLMTNKIDEAIKWSELIIITNKEKEFQGLFFDDSKIIVDLTRLDEYRSHPNYCGINW